MVPNLGQYSSQGRLAILEPYLIAQLQGIGSEKYYLRLVGVETRDAAKHPIIYKELFILEC